MHRPLLIAALLATGVAAPARAAVEHYVVDPGHSFPSLEFPHMGISVWRGKFNRTSGHVTLDRVARSGTVEVTIDTASIDFGLDSMHEHAVSADWFDVAKHPTASYKGTIRFDGDRPAAVDGALTVKGITRPVPLTIRSFACIPHPLTRKQVCGADAEGSLHWADFGMKKWGDGDADKVTLRIQVEAAKQD